MIFGAGFGLGIGYSNCQHELQSPYAIRGKYVLVSKHFILAPITIVVLLMCCCFMSTVNSYGHVGTVS